MGARKRRRSRFEYLGRQYHWWFDDAWRVHICSEDKKFVVAYYAGDSRREPPFDGPLIEVHGEQFPGIETNDPRPVLLHVPKFITDEWSKSMGALVNAVIRWSVRDSHKLKRARVTSLADRPTSTK